MKKVYILTEKKLKKLINERVEEVKRETNNELQKMVMEKDANLASLQSQINPHFLYNALEGIRGQAILDEAPVIEKIAQALAYYFRYSISSKNDVVTLAEELENVKNYLSIQEFRFQSRFHYEILYEKEDAEALETLLPKMTLQPIVENAIQHGMERKKKDSLLRIKIEFAGNIVNVIISDNGAGMDADTLERLNKKIRIFNVFKREEGRHNGIAMPNVNRRIQLMFGEDYGLHISSIRGMGTDVEIHLPFCTVYGEEGKEETGGKI